MLGGIMKNTAKKDLTQEWLLKFLGYYVENKLRIKFNLKNDYTINLNFICHDKRRIPTARRFLESLNLIKLSYSTSTAMDYCDEEIEKILPSQSQEPVFSTSGIIKERKYSLDTTKAATNRVDLYKNIDCFNSKELIHIYLNQDNYDFHILKKIHTYYRKRLPKTSERFELLVYPKEKIENADDNIFKALVKEYADKHAREILTHALDIPFKYLDDKKSYTTVTEIGSHINKVLDKIGQLELIKEDLFNLRDAVKKIGEEEYSKLLTEKSIEYVENRSPIWAYKGNDEQKILATLRLKGMELKDEIRTY